MNASSGGQLENPESGTAETENGNGIKEASLPRANRALIPCLSESIGMVLP